jgi:hypothetical protein
MTEKDIQRYGRASIVRPPTRKVFVFGPEGAANYNLVRDKLNRVTYWFDDIVLFTRSDDHPGIGAIAQRWADERYNRYFTYTYHPFPEVYGKADAPAKRDELLLADLTREYRGYAVAFTDHKDPTVRYLIQLCDWYDVKVKTIRYEE